MLLKPNIYKKITKHLKLDKPLIIFDIEATGLNLHSDKIVELAYIKILPTGRIKKDDMILNPEMTISAEAISIHGIRNRFVANKPKFREKAQELWELFNDCYYSGFNVHNFDLPLLRREFIRCGLDFEYSYKKIIDTKKIFYTMVPQTLSAAYEYYIKKDFTQWHTALIDTEVTAEILAKQLDKYEECRDWEFINKMHNADNEAHTNSTRKFYWLRGEAYFAFSKYRDKPLKEIAKKDPKFLEWIIKADFNDKVKNVVSKTIEKNKKF